MLSRFTWRALNFSIRAAIISHVAAFTLDVNSKCLRVTNSRSQKSICYLVTIFLWGHALFRLGRMIYTVTFQFNPEYVFTQFFFVSASILAVFMNLEFIVHQHEFSQTYTMFWKLEKLLHGQFQVRPLRHEIPKITAKFFRAIFILQTGAQLQMYFEKTRMPTYLFSMFFDSKGHYIYKFMFLIPEALAIIFFWSLFALLALPGLSFLCFVSYWVKQQTLYKDANLLYTSSACREFRTVTHTFRCVHMLVTSFNQCYTISITSSKLFTITLAATSIYGSIRLFGSISFVSYALMPVTFIACTAVGLILDPQGYIIEKSIRKFRISWLTAAHEKKYNSRQIRVFINSCPILHFKFGNFYNFGQNTVLTFLHTIIDNAVGLLIAF